MPACASVRPKPPAMLLKRPMGMNSEVLNTKAEQVRPASASHCRAVMASLCEEAVRAAAPRSADDSGAAAAADVISTATASPHFSIVRPLSLLFRRSPYPTNGSRL